eukprot:TRINITY_DN6611_c0_g1_i4.p1 TRINITY_DN6611_c0_g1~~TRINITY_DN6611_c0_g1_i4.p1  ORF type:complete len:318 (+),score=60.94 TRINITY_DN6611_c0_g1_i4:1024-1977(+)
MSPIMERFQSIILDWEDVHLRCLFGRGHADVTSQDGTVYQDIDGIHVALYYHHQTWQLCTAYEPIHPQMEVMWNSKDKCTLEHAFWTTWRLKNYDDPPNQQLCYHFVWISGRHRQIVDYPEDDILVTGAIDLHTCTELPLSQIVSNTNWKMPPTIQASSLEDLRIQVENANPFKLKGAVFQNRDFSRCYITHPNWIAASAVTSQTTNFQLWAATVTDHQMLDIIRFQLQDAFVDHFPTLKPGFQLMQSQYRAMCQCIQQTFVEIKDMDDKTFAIHAKSKWYHFILFGMRQNPCLDLILRTKDIDTLFKIFQKHITSG